MIEFIVVTCDSNHSDYRTTRVHANDIDTAAVKAVDNARNRIVKAVVEYEDGEVGEVIAALRAGILVQAR